MRLFWVDEPIKNWYPCNFKSIYNVVGVKSVVFYLPTRNTISEQLLLHSWSFAQLFAHSNQRGGEDNIEGGRRCNFHKND